MSLFISIVLLVLLPSVGLAANDNATGGNFSTDSNDDLAFFLLQLQADIQGSLSDQDVLVADASEQLSAAGLEGGKAREILQSLNDSGFSEAVTISQQGKILAAEPSQYNASEGADVGSQKGWTSFLKIKNPVLSQMYQLVEGYDAISFIYPVISPAGEFAGAVSASMKPGELLGAIIAPMLNGTPFNAWVMQKDGLILYDADPSQEGLMLFQDPLYQPYPSLLDIGRKMVAERSGMGSYYFLNKEHNQNVTKEVYWTTVGLHGNEWRLAIIRVVG
jgi:polar amino acid transport system substrate-binding protein